MADKDCMTLDELETELQVQEQAQERSDDFSMFERGWFADGEAGLATEQLKESDLLN